MKIKGSMKKSVRILVHRLSALLLMFTLSFSLFSCGEKNREYDEEEVSAAAIALIKESKFLDVIYFGDGIPADTLSTEGFAYYKPANFIWLDENGFSTLEELKKMTTNVYTSSYSQLLFSSTFSGISGADGSAGEVLARYIQKYVGDDPLAGEECILVYTRTEPLYTADKNEHLYETLKVTESRGQRVFITIDVLVTEGDVTERVTQRIGLIEEADGWRLDNSTFANLPVALS